MRTCVVIPSYRNGGTVVDVARRALQQIPDVIVVVDGSPDDTLERLAHAELPITVVSYPENRGKGGALVAGFDKAREMGFDYALTLDSDGQHFPEDIPVFLNAVAANPGALVVGSRDLQAENMPGKNTFANRFSNFWFRLYTWVDLPDTQTGFRAYPLESLPATALLTSRYEAELELLVFSAWRGTRLVPAPIRVYYAPDGERVSSFRPGRDFARISLLNTVLLVAALLYGWPRMLFSRIFR